MIHVIHVEQIDTIEDESARGHNRRHDVSDTSKRNRMSSASAGSSHECRTHPTFQSPDAGWRVRAAGQAVWPVCRSQQQQHLRQAWLCKSSLSCTRRDVRIHKFEVRISPQILTEDPQPRARGRQPSVGR